MTKLFANTEATDVEFEDLELEIPEMLVERVALTILNWLLIAVKAILFFIAVKVIWKLTLYIWNGAVKTLESLWQSFIKAVGEAFGRVIGWVVAVVVVAAFTMSFTANGYSLSKTFSWKGIVTLYETWK